MNNKTFQKIYKKIIQNIFKLIYGKVSYYPNSNKTSAIKKIIIKNKNFNNKKYFTYKIDKGRVYTDCIQNVASISNNILHGPSSFQYAKDKIISPRFNAVLEDGTPRVRKEYNGTILSLIQGASGENYFHWLMDILPRIKICSENYPINKINYFYIPNPSAAQRESLNLLGIKKKKIINSKLLRHIIADEIIFTTHPWCDKGKFNDQSNKLTDWSVFWLREKFLKFKKKFKTSDRIFLDRSDNKYPRLNNYHQIRKKLEKQNFQFIELSKLSFVKQIYLFWNAKYIIGPHGAAFTNLVFCKPRTNVIELKPYNHPGKYYERISKINKLNYKSIYSPKKYLHDSKGDIYIDIKILNKAMNK